MLAVVILGGAGAGYLYYEHLNGNIRHDDLNIGDAKDRAAGTKANSDGQTALNILLIGSDARDTAANQKLGGAKYDFGGPPLADVQMLLHVSADRSNMSVVSMPRDTLLDIPKCTDPDDGTIYPALHGGMTNASLSRGGPGCTVATWEKLTDIHIDHFMMIDFAGVVSMADAIGGVPVCVDANVYSHTSTGKGSGLKLEKGTHSVKGEQALQWLRTRYGFEDDTDLARAKAQHMYMNSMVRELRASAKLTNPNKLRKLAEAATKAITVDDGLDTVSKLYDLAGELQKVPTDRITMTTMPEPLPGRTGWCPRTTPGSCSVWCARTSPWTARTQARPPPLPRRRRRRPGGRRATRSRCRSRTARRTSAQGAVARTGHARWPGCWPARASPRPSRTPRPPPPRRRRWSATRAPT